MKFTSHIIFKTLVFVGIILNQQAISHGFVLQSDANYFTRKIDNTSIIDLLLTDSKLFNSDQLYSISKLFYNNNINNMLDNTTIENPNNIKLLLQNKMENYIDKLNAKNNYFNNLSLITNNTENANILPLYKRCENKPLFYNSKVLSLIDNIDKYKKITLNIDSTNNKLSNLPFIISNTNKSNIKITRNKKINKKTHNNKIQTKKKNTLNKNLPINELIKQAENSKNIPSGLLRAIGLVESRLQPYAINYRGRGYFFNTKESALQFVNSLIKRGETNFGVGCFQLHYRSHANKFSSVSVMLDPVKNIEYAAKLLNRLYKEHGYKWSNAVKRYHSSRSDLNSVYYYKVVGKLGRTI